MTPEEALPLARGAIRERAAEFQRKTDVAARAVGTAEAAFDDTVRAAQGDKDALKANFLRYSAPVESGNVAAMPDELRQPAEFFREAFDNRKPDLARLGLVKDFIDNYMGHMVADPNNPNATPQELGAKLSSRRTLAGQEGYRKGRREDLPTWQDVFDAGLEPKVWNPITMERMKLREVDKSLMGHQVVDELKEKGALKFTPLSKSLPADQAFLNDKLGRVFAPGETKLREYFDKQQMEGLEKFADSLGIDVKTALSGTPGRSDPQGVVRRFGTPESVLAHEIGHQLDDRYRLATRILGAPGPIQAELRNLADLRASGQVSQEYRDYLRSRPEQIANLVAAYVHTPELLKQEAPVAAKWFDDFLASKPELAPLRDIKPSLELGERDQMKRLAGPMLTGNYAGPKAVIDLINNHLSPGLSDYAAYRGTRAVANTVNMFNLGLSGWHALGTAINTQLSSLALGAKMMSRGDFMQSLGPLVRGFTPGVAMFKAGAEGLKVMREWYSPGSQGAEYAQAVQDTIKAGGRAGMDQFYKADHIEALTNGLKDLAAGKTELGQAMLPVRAAGALAELLNRPTMEYWVPMCKLGASMEAMRYEADSMARRGLPLDTETFRDRFGKIWDSMDNRFGQLVYDNLFINRVFKDSAMLAVRAVGWNVGTWREFGGAVKDLPSSMRGLKSGEGISDRLAYVIAGTVGVSLAGAVTQYLLTGKGPESFKDLLFPRTGRKNKDGTDERLSFPTYWHHDVAPLFNRGDEGPLRWLSNAASMGKAKLNPVLTIPWDAITNSDWQDTAIRDPNDPIMRQTGDTLSFMLKQLEPYSVQSAGQSAREGKPGWEQAAPFLGVVPATANVRRTAEEQRAMESGRKFQATPLQRKRMGLR